MTLGLAGFGRARQDSEHRSGNFSFAAVAAGLGMARLLLVGIVAVIAAVAVAWTGARVLDGRSGPPIIIDDPRADETIMVAVEGAVATPGVYPLGADARMRDALAAAGGPSADADLSAVNLAARVRDEERIVVPRRSATTQTEIAGASLAVDPTPPQPTPSPTAIPGQAPMAAAVDINTASAAELETLPGIGPAKAAGIVDYRTEHGPFQSIEELANVQGISPAMVDDLRGLITV
jgi:competence protein ComEA